MQDTLNNDLSDLNADQFITPRKWLCTLLKKEAHVKKNDKAQMIRYFNCRILLILFMAFSWAFGNIGGVFYKKSIAGISIDSVKSITYAETEINCKDSICHFMGWSIGVNTKEFSRNYIWIRFTWNRWYRGKKQCFISQVVNVV